MMRHVQALGSAALSVVFIASGCTHRVKVEPVKVEITARVDIYQHAADIEDMVSGEKPIPKQPEAAEEQPKTGFMLVFVSAALAQEPQIRTITPEVARRIGSRKARNSEVARARSEAVIGENNRGLLEFIPGPRAERDPGYKKRILELVRAENDDRSFIYGEIARQKGTEEREVGFAFARVHYKKARPGEWVQVPEDEKELEEFKKSEMGRSVGEDIKPGKWVKR